MAGIVALGRSLELETIAEGIETDEQLCELRALGCRYGQGYLFARPMDSAILGRMTSAPCVLPIGRSADEGTGVRVA